MASWCDKLASTPTVGIKFNPVFLSGDALLGALRPIIDTFPQGDDLRLQIEKHDSFGVQFASMDGYHYGVDSQRAFVDFRHRMKAKAVSAGPPILEMLSRAAPYTELLDEVLSKLTRMALLLASAIPRDLERVGFISTTIVDEAEAPPGIRRYVEYLARPWNGATDEYQLNITGRTTDTAEHSDRCIHTISRAEAAEGLMTIKLDWQRTFKVPQSLIETRLERELSAARESALLYFEDVAEGNRFDEQVIRQEK